MPTPASRRRSVYLKLAGIGVLILLLHIPVLLTDGVLQERRAYRQQATGEISAVWGGRQTVTGPVLAVPYARRVIVARSRIVGGQVVTVDEAQFRPAEAYFLPEVFEVSGQVSPELRHRGIYTSVVYSASLRLAGSFRPDFGAAGIEADRIDWAKARVFLGVSDLRGVRALGGVRGAANDDSEFAPADEADREFLPLAAPATGVQPAADWAFSFALTLQGSEQLQIAPVGKTTRVTLNSDWPDPSFCGRYLPVKRVVRPDGFHAEWSTSYLSRNFPQSWARPATNSVITSRISDAAFGVAFAQPVDGYRLAERAQKYALLFFVLVFAVFFLFEVTAALRIHWLQYGLVGAGLCLFFLGFLALLEFMPAGLAYAWAAAACTALVSLYAWSLLKTGRRSLKIAGGLAATYGCLYFVLRSEDYALLAGTAALFAALALLMYGTRRIDWYQPDGCPAAASEAVKPVPD